MTKDKLKKIFIGVGAIFVVLVIAFYFIAGDGLKYRESRFDILLPDIKDSSTDELTTGVVVEQRFINKVDRLKSVSFECTTHYRTNSGTITAELYHNYDLLIKENILASDVEEGVPITITSDKYLENLTGQELKLKLTSTSTKGNGVTPLVFSWNPDGTYLTVNGKDVVGGLVFSTSGQEYIFTGQYYWYIAGAMCLILFITLFIAYRNYCKGKAGYVVRAIEAIDQYQFLISQLVSRDFKTKYKRSVLGIFWSFLNPLLTMIVQFFVFSTFFKSDISNYPVYLLSGVVCYSFFSECTTMCLTSISGNARLITKVYIPKYIFPLSRTISSSVNLGISLIPLILVSVITGLALHQSVLLIIFFLLCLVVFSLGIGMLLATLMVFFRDIQFLWSVLSMIWMYATPIFYPASIIPAKYSFIIRMNPLYHFIKNVRICLIDGVSPEPRNYLYCFLFAIGSLLIGSLVFKKNQDKFTLYL